MEINGVRPRVFISFFCNCYKLEFQKFEDLENIRPLI